MAEVIDRSLDIENVERFVYFETSEAMDSGRPLGSRRLLIWGYIAKFQKSIDEKKEASFKCTWYLQTYE